MSYYFEIAFLPCSELDSFKKAKELCRSDMSHKKDIIRDNLFFLGRDKSQNIPLHLAVKNLFYRRFLYWHELGLCGVFGGTIREYTKEIFPVHIAFQNSCDQDYDYEVWDDRIPLFKQMKDEVLHLSDRQIQDLSYDYDPDDWTDMASFLDYQRKSILYQKIYEKLDLNNVLYGNPCKPERFSMCAINTQEELLALTTLARVMLKSE